MPETLFIDNTVNVGELFERLKKAHQDAKPTRIKLDSGESFLLMPDKDFEALHKLFNNPSFLKQLEGSVARYLEGDVEPLDCDANVTETKRS